MTDHEGTFVKVSIETKTSPDSLQSDVSRHVKEFTVDFDWPLPAAIASLVHICVRGVLTDKDPGDMDVFYKEWEDILDRAEMLKEKK